MKVILFEDIKGVGKKDQIIEVKEGYAKNFLFPTKKAAIATADQINKLKTKQENKEFYDQKEFEKATALKEQLEKQTYTLYVKAGQNGKLFGTVTPDQIATMVYDKTKIQIDKKKVAINGSIKLLGEYDVVLKLLPGKVNATIQVDVREEK